MNSELLCKYFLEKQGEKFGESEEDLRTYNISTIIDK
jgi:hypothetical protein